MTTLTILLLQNSKSYNACPLLSRCIWWEICLLTFFSSEALFNKVNTKQKADAIQSLLTNALKNEKIDVKSLEITSNYLQEEFEVMSVFVDISNNKAETKEELKNNIIKIIQANININKEKIVFNEWNFKKNIKSIYSEKN